MPAKKSPKAKKPPIKVAKKASKVASPKPAVKTKPAKVGKKPIAPLKKSAPVASQKAAPKKKEVAKPAPKSPVKAAVKPPAKSPTKAVKAPATPPPAKPVQNVAFLKKQRERLLQLKDTLLDSMNGVARDSLRSGANNGDASAFGMHQADAGSDAYDRDFALSLLSQEQDSLYEIDQALKRVEQGNYGVCEISNKPIPAARLEALPFTRYTVECQAELEKRNRYRVRQPVTSLFGLGDDESGEGDEEESYDNKE